MFSFHEIKELFCRRLWGKIRVLQFKSASFLISLKKQLRECVFMQMMSQNSIIFARYFHRYLGYYVDSETPSAKSIALTTLICNQMISMTISSQIGEV